MKKGNSIRLERKQALPMDEIIGQYIREMKLLNGLNRRRIFAAWDEASGAAAYTVDRQLRNGVLYCTLSSSVVRNHLYFQKDAIVQRINGILANDSLFVKDSPKDGFIKSIILK